MRAIVYAAKAPNGEQWKIFIDLVKEKDIGLDQARSEFLAKALDEGFTLTDEFYRSIKRHEIG